MDYPKPLKSDQIIIEELYAELQRLRLALHTVRESIDNRLVIDYIDEVLNV